MNFDAVLTAEAHDRAEAHLLKHIRRSKTQEDLCFALWKPSTGATRFSAVISDLLLPRRGERLLHGNASFAPHYLARAIMTARRRNMGVAFMHSHPSPGWQDMSSADIIAERDVIAYPANATGLPLLGLTIGEDGNWSARFWKRDGSVMRREWCAKVRIVTARRWNFHHNDRLCPPPPRRNILRRTFDTWGRDAQNSIARLRIGVVGLGSVGSLVAESIVRMGVAQITLIDPDRVEEHNLDRLLHATHRDIGGFKVDVAAHRLQRHATAARIDIHRLPLSVHDRDGYLGALDCDLLFSCVDRPVARDVLNYIANAHLVPVVDAGVSVQTDTNRDRFFSSHWRTQIVTPYHQCLRCSEQYSSGMVVAELDGSLDDPSYVRTLPDGSTRNENVFPFALGVAGMQVNLGLRHLLSPQWWPNAPSQEHQFITAETRVLNNECHEYCSFRNRRARGDDEMPHYIQPKRMPSRRSRFRRWVATTLGNVLSRC